MESFFFGTFLYIKKINKTMVFLILIFGLDKKIMTGKNETFSRN
jgi:hypothetical protein